jgi:AraC-like DNA-binding protein
MLARPAHTTVRVASLQGLDVLMAQAGVDLRDTLRRVGIDPVVLEEPDNRLSMRQMVQVLDAAAAATGDSCLGLHLGAAQSLQVAGVLGYALQSSPDVRTQIALAARYFSLHQDGAEISLVVQGDLAELRYAVVDPDVTLHRHDAEASAALCVSQWRTLTAQADWAPLSVHFEHPEPAPDAQRELKRYFRCPLHFSDRFHGLRVPRTFLDTPIRTADEALHKILTRYAEESLARHGSATTLTGRIRRLQAAGLGAGQARIEDVAARLAMTPRTLQRHLADEGRQFAELLDETRRDLAAQYLRDRQLTLTDTAFLVGYSDLTAFHRAFRRWFGQTPLDYQRQLRAAPPPGF